MDHLHTSDTPEENRKFPVRTLVVTIVILAAAAAILVFNVPWTTVLTYGLFGLLAFGCLFMHGAHGGQDHGASNAQPNSGHTHSDPDASQISAHQHADGPAQPARPDEKPTEKTDSHQGHSGC